MAVTRGIWLICTPCTIFVAKVCAKLHLDICPKLWYNKYVNKRNEDNTMALFNKKKNLANMDTALDQRIKEIECERAATSYSILERAKRVIICNGAIDLYPEGADKEAAKKEAEKAKELLICAIGHYDDLRRQYLEAIKSEGERRTTVLYCCNPPKSHFWVEKAYEEFWKKN